MNARFFVTITKNRRGRLFSGLTEQDWRSTMGASIQRKEEAARRNGARISEPDRGSTAESGEVYRGGGLSFIEQNNNFVQ